MNNTLKKSIASVLSLVLCVLLINPVTSNASEQIDENPEIIQTYTNDEGNSITKFDDGVIVEVNPNTEEFNIIVPAYQSEVETEILSNTGSSIQPRIPGWLVTALVYLKKVGAVLSACSIIENYIWTGMDPCKIVAKHLFQSNISGNYVISSKYNSGYIPGCQPQHTSACYGYYEYQFIKK